MTFSPPRGSSSRDRLAGPSRAEPSRADPTSGWVDPENTMKVARHAPLAIALTPRRPFASPSLSPGRGRSSPRRAVGLISRALQQHHSQRGVGAVGDGTNETTGTNTTNESRVEEGCWFRLRLTSISGFPRLWRNIRLPCQHLLLPRQTGLADFPHPAFPNLSAASMHQGSARFVHSGWKPSSSSST
mgnify:CR=1 FL=1